MLAAALLAPAARVAGFTAGTAAAVALHWREVLNWNLGVQLALYGAAAVFFLRCRCDLICQQCSIHKMLHLMFATLAGEEIHGWDAESSS